MSEPIPEGYMQNATGDLVRIENVRDHDLLRDQVALDIAAKAKQLEQALTKFKSETLSDIEDLISIAAEKYGKKMGGKKGNVSILSYDGRYKILRVHADQITFTEELKAARALFNDCINNWAKGANDHLRTLIGSAFKTNGKGELKKSELLKLLRHKIDDPNYQKACEALKDSILVVGTTTYLRVYERVGKTDQYRQIALDVAQVFIADDDEVQA